MCATLLLANLTENSVERVILGIFGIVMYRKDTVIEIMSMEDTSQFLRCDLHWGLTMLKTQILRQIRSSGYNTLTFIPDST